MRTKPMTEAEWNGCTDPTTMLAFLRDTGKLTERKARLFAVAVCRRIWPLLTDDEGRRAVEVAELYADGLVNKDALEVALEEAWVATTNLVAAERWKDAVANRAARMTLMADAAE